jgi:hypothetical protein
MWCSGRGNSSSSLVGLSTVPGADAETALLLFEPGAVINTGDAGRELTAEVEELA